MLKYSMQKIKNKLNYYWIKFGGFDWRLQLMLGLIAYTVHNMLVLAVFS